MAGMRISALAGMWMCAFFGLVCAGVAAKGFWEASGLPDPTAHDAALGYAWFWTFLAAVAAVFGVLSWMIKEGKFGDVDGV